MPDDDHPQLAEPFQAEGGFMEAVRRTQEEGPAISHHGGYEDAIAHATLAAGYERPGVEAHAVLAEQDAITWPKVAERWTDLRHLIPEDARCGRTWDPHPHVMPFECTRRAHDPAVKGHVAARGGEVVAVWDLDGGTYQAADGSVHNTRVLPEPVPEPLPEPEETPIADGLVTGTVSATLITEAHIAATTPIELRRRHPMAGLAYLANQLSEELAKHADTPIAPGAVAVNPDGTAYRLTEDGTWAALHSQ